MGKYKSRAELTKELFGERIITPSGCWEWTGTDDGRGYGRIYAKILKPRSKSGAERVHRVAGVLFLGWQLKGRKKFLHKCDNRKCFNPAHLYRGTSRDNILDAYTRGRIDNEEKSRKLQGTKNPNAILTEEQVKQIRGMARVGKLSNREIGSRFGVHKSTIQGIVVGDDWKALLPKRESEAKDG